MKKIFAAVIGLLAAAFTLHEPVIHPSASDTPILLREGTEKVFHFQRPLFLDLLWLREISEIGAAESPERNLAVLSSGTTLTNLDPRFSTAYYFTALNSPYYTENRKWLYGAETSQLLEHALEQFPTNLQFHIYLGYNLYSVEKRFRRASEVFLRGSKLPAAPNFLAPLATRLLSQDGDAINGLSLARQLAESAEDDETRAEFQKRVRDLEIEVVLQAVDKANLSFRERTGKFASTVAELQNTDLYQGPVTDPQGGIISLKETGESTSTSLERRLQLYE